MNRRVAHTIRCLSECRWFRAVGETVVDGSVAVLTSWEQVINPDDANRWSNTQIQAANRFRASLRERDADRYHTWNAAAAELRPIAIKIGLTKVKESIGHLPFHGAIVDAAQWDVLHWLLCERFGDVITDDFYPALGAWYLAGHFPCDWRGDFPFGSLVVY